MKKRLTFDFIVHLQYEKKCHSVKKKQSSDALAGKKAFVVLVCRKVCVCTFIHKFNLNFHAP